MEKSYVPCAPHKWPAKEYILHPLFEIEQSEHYWCQLQRNRYLVLEYRDGHFEISVNGTIQYKTFSPRYGYYFTVPLIFKTLAEARCELNKKFQCDLQAHLATEANYKKSLGYQSIRRRIPLRSN
jgi:hypothetical protein